MFKLFPALAVLVASVVLVIGCGGDDTPSQQEIVDQGQTATLQVIARQSGVTPQGESGQIQGAGSAWVYDAEQGYIVTNAHVVVDGSKFTAGYDSTQQTKAVVVGVDLAHDIAVLRVSPSYLSGLTDLELADPASVEQGETVYALGYPGNGGSNFLQTPYQSTTGTITSTDTQVTVGYGYFVNSNSGLVQSGVYQTDAAINPGNSGGPLVDDQGEVVGMNYAGGGGEAQGDAIPVEILSQVVPELIDGQSNAWLGFGVSAIPTGLANQLGIPGAMVITQVTQDTPADQAGLTGFLSDATRAGTYLLILSVNNQPVADMQQYVNSLESIESGERVALELGIPGYGVQTVHITYP